MPLRDLIAKALDGLDTPEDGRRLRTGWAELDDLTRGIGPGEIWLVTGATGMGKSTFVTNLATQVALEAPASTALFISRDTDREDVPLRILSARSQVSHHKMRARSVSEEDWDRLRRTAAGLMTAPLHIAPAPPEGLGPIRETIAAAARGCGDPIRLAVIDELPPTTAAEELWSLRSFARTHEVAIVATMPGTHEPWTVVRSALGGAADLILKVHRPDATDPLSHRAGEADLAVLRHRAGPTATFTVAFQGHYARLVSMFVER